MRQINNEEEGGVEEEKGEIDDDKVGNAEGGIEKGRSTRRRRNRGEGNERQML